MKKRLLSHSKRAAAGSAALQGGSFAPQGHFVLKTWVTIWTYPARTENDIEDRTLAHALLAIPEKSFRVLRVVYNETIDPVSVVTAYFDDEVTNL